MLVTSPVAMPTDTTAVDGGDQVPPVVEWLSVVLPPIHIVRVPVIVAGAGVTVITRDVVHPALTEYTIVAVPDDTPVAIPEEGSMTAMPGSVQDQPPPGEALVSVILEPTQTVDGPTIGGAAVTTVTTFVVEQPPTL